MIYTTTEADRQGVAIVEPLTITATVGGPYLSTEAHTFVTPNEFQGDPVAMEAELNRWAASRGFRRIPGLNTYVRVA